MLSATAPAGAGGVDSALRSLLMIAEFHGIAADEAKLRHEFGREPFTTRTLLLAARRLGLSARLVRQPPERLDRAPLPAVAIDSEGRFFVAGKYDAAQGHPRLLIQRPGEPPQVLAQAQFESLWTGELIFFASKADHAGETAKFDFSWFVPAIVKYRRLLGEVLLIFAGGARSLELYR